MPTAKRGLTVRATNTADICICGHPINVHDASENCRFKTGHVGNACGCTSIRVERNAA